MRRRSGLNLIDLLKGLVGIFVVGAAIFATWSWIFSSPDYGDVPSATGDVIGLYELDTAFTDFFTTKNIQITAFDDPMVKGVTCHVSDVVAGGLSWADDPSNASIACRQTGPIVIAGATEANPWGDLPLGGQDVFGATKGWWKALQVRRWVDTDRNVLVYVVFTPKWGSDSNKNVISTVSLYAPK